MQVIKELHYPLKRADDLFVESAEFSKTWLPTDEAKGIASRELGVPVSELSWNIPDVFDVRYGSSYIATAFANGKAVRFHTKEGDFREGDDKVVTK